jgi:hypothetical protein
MDNANSATRSWAPLKESEAEYQQEKVPAICACSFAKFSHEKGLKTNWATRDQVPSRSQTQFAISCVRSIKVNTLEALFSP